MEIVGHRGAKGLAPENTLSSISKALEYAVDEVEIDVRVSLDGVAILGHGSKLKDAVGNSLTIPHTNYAELKQHKGDLTTLDEAMDYTKGKVRLCIEVKRHVKVKAVATVIKQQIGRGYPAKDLTVASFSLPTLKVFRRLFPDLNLAVNEQWSGVLAHYRAKQVDSKRLNMQRRWLWHGYVAPLAKRGYRIYGFTINDPRLARKMSRYGLAGAITDYPDRFTKHA